MPEQIKKVIKIGLLLGKVPVCKSLIIQSCKQAIILISKQGKDGVSSNYNIILEVNFIEETIAVASNPYMFIELCKGRLAKA